MNYHLLAQKMPKIELHCHLSGSTAPQTLSYIATHFHTQGVPTDVIEIAKELHVTTDCESLDDYLKKFIFAGKYLNTKESIVYATKELIRDAKSQNILHLEIRIGVHMLSKNGISHGDVIDAFSQGIQEGRTEQDISVVGIIILGRAFDVEINKSIITIAKDYMDKGIVGVDVAGPEGSFPPMVQYESIQYAKSFGFHVTFHAGEAGSADNIVDAVFQIGADRIGHGTFINQVDGLLERLVAKGTGVEMCPTSNFLTKAIPNWESYGIRDYFDGGLKLCVCADDPAMSNINLTHEYALVMEKFAFSTEDMKQMVLNAVDISFIPQSEKTHLSAIVNAQFLSL